MSRCFSVIRFTIRLTRVVQVMRPWASSRKSAKGSRAGSGRPGLQLARHAKGAYAQYVLHSAEDLIRVPEHLSNEGLASLELSMCVGTVFRMLAQMDAIRGQCFGVSGLGPAGLIAVQMARAGGIVPDHVIEGRAMPHRGLVSRSGLSSHPF